MKREFSLSPSKETILAILIGLQAQSALAREPAALTHRCVRNDEQMRVLVVPERPKGELPCQVLVASDRRSPEQLWRVQFERGVCAAKADRKRRLLERDGWTCTTTANTPWARTAGKEEPGAAQSVPTTSDDASADDGTTAVDRDLETLLLEAGDRQTASLTLEQAVSLALRNNRSIKSGYLTRAGDRLGLQQAEDQFRPDLTIEGGPDWSSDGSTSGGLSSTIAMALPTGGDISLSWANQLEADTGTTTLSAEFRQPLLRGGGLDANLASLRQARIGHDIGRLSLREIISGTITSVIQAHRSLNLAQIEIDVAERALLRAREQKRVSLKLFEAGRIPRLDIVQNDAEIASLDVGLASTRLSLEDARRNLLQLLDIDTKADLIAKESVTDRDIALDVTTALSIAFANRPDFLSAQLSDQATRLGLAVAKSEQLWNLDTVFGAGYADRFYESGAGFREDGEVNYDAGMRFSIPFGDVGQRQAVQRVKLGMRNSQLSLIELKNSIETEINALLANIQTLKSQISLAERAVVLAENQLKAERSKFAGGLSSTLDLISLEDGLVDAQLAVFQTEVAYSDAVTGLDQALGTTLQSWAIDLKQE